MEAVHYVEENQYGTIVVAGTAIHVLAIGIAHEDGTSQEELLEWFSLNKEQLYGALAYFYGHRDTLLAHEKESSASAKVQELGKSSKFSDWRKDKT